MITMTTPNKATQTAAASYAERQAEANELLKQIAQQLDRHATLQASNAESWAYPGDLGRVTEQLAYVLASLGDRSAVDAKGLNY